jgi:hypothetical protein
VPPDSLREPWRSFLKALDDSLRVPTELHCLGGFVVAECYGLTRATADLDVIESTGTNLAELAKIAGRGTALHNRHKLFIDVVTVADVPDDYEQRLTPVLDGSFTHLRLRAFERHDLVLAKLTRNSDRDRAGARRPGSQDPLSERAALQARQPASRGSDARSLD